MTLMKQVILSGTKPVDFVAPLSLPPVIMSADIAAMRRMTKRAANDLHTPPRLCECRGRRVLKRMGGAGRTIVVLCAGSPQRCALSCDPLVTISFCLSALSNKLKPSFWSATNCLQHEKGSLAIPSNVLLTPSDTSTIAAKKLPPSVKKSPHFQRE